MNRKSKKKKLIIAFIIIIIFLIAGLLDIKYKGLFFQLLPSSMQSFLGEYFAFAKGW